MPDHLALYDSLSIRRTACTLTGYAAMLGVRPRLCTVKGPRSSKRLAWLLLTLGEQAETVLLGSASRQPRDALYAGFDVMERELHDFRSLRRGVSKDPGPRVRGRIIRLFADRGYGHRQDREEKPGHRQQPLWGTPSGCIIVLSNPMWLTGGLLSRYIIVSLTCQGKLRVAYIWRDYGSCGLIPGV